MKITTLTPDQILPLTCSRAGACCYGKLVRLNPWELALISSAKLLNTLEFSQRYCDCNGAHLLFAGTANSKRVKSCNMYHPEQGCTVHSGRPLACRLYPLGRQLQNGTTQYIYQGTEFPCLESCSEVLQLPTMTVKEYIQEQKAENFELAQNTYLEVVQNIADFAFEILLEHKLSASIQNEILADWKFFGEQDATILFKKLNNAWKQTLMHPAIELSADPTAFITAHNLMILQQIQSEIAENNSPEKLANLSTRYMVLALSLAWSVGANTQSLATRWIAIAKSV